jgi:signal transduction histidine kinase
VLGTGLGMPIVQEIVHLHGGQVLMASQPGKGSTATVWLPRRSPAPALPSQAASTA